MVYIGKLIMQINGSMQAMLFASKDSFDCALSYGVKFTRLTVAISSCNTTIKLLKMCLACTCKPTLHCWNKFSKDFSKVPCPWLWTNLSISKRNWNKSTLILFQSPLKKFLNMPWLCPWLLNFRNRAENSLSSSGCNPANTLQIFMLFASTVTQLTKCHFIWYQVHEAQKMITMSIFRSNMSVKVLKKCLGCLGKPTLYCWNLTDIDDICFRRWLTLCPFTWYQVHEAQIMVTKAISWCNMAVKLLKKCLVCYCKPTLHCWNIFQKISQQFFALGCEPTLLFQKRNLKKINFKKLNRIFSIFKRL